MESLWEHKETMLLMIFLILPFSMPVGIMERCIVRCYF